MKKIVCGIVVSMLLGTPCLSVAYDKKCVVALKRSDGSTLKALLSKKDCKRVSSLKKGEKIQLIFRRDNFTIDAVEDLGGPTAATNF